MGHVNLSDDMPVFVYTEPLCSLTYAWQNSFYGGFSQRLFCIL